MSESTTKEKRTSQQNRALHKWLASVAETLNDAGLDMVRTLKPGVDIPWTQESVKSHLWKPVQEAMFNDDSTAEMDTKAYNQVRETLTRHAAAKLGVTLPPWMQKEFQE